MSQDHSNCPVDPRIQVELEKLNTATDNINKYEVELDEAKNDFKQLLVDSVDRIKQAAHKLNNSIQTAKPYYEARLYAGQLAKEHQVAAANHERARSVHAVAKEMVYLAEQGLGEKSTLDTACQEMLSHAASRVNESQLEFTETKNTMKICELKQEVAKARVAKLQSQLKSAIKASSLRIRRTFLMINFQLMKRDYDVEPPYYETRAKYNGQLMAQKSHITDLEKRVRDAKLTYNEALRLLEQISEEIHRQRGSATAQLSADPLAPAALLPAGSSSTSGPDEEPLLPPYTRLSSANSSAIFSADEYLEFPERLSPSASPVHQPQLQPLDCPHLMRDFAHSTAATSNPTDGQSTVPMTSDDIEQWTEIRLSKSESTSSGYSQHSQHSSADGVGGRRTPTTADGEAGDRNDDDDEEEEEEASAASLMGRRISRVTCHSLFSRDDGKKTPGTPTSAGGEGLAGWISKSNAKQQAASGGSRRQSLDILLDASDRVKDVFATGFQRVGKSLERRNSESEVSGGLGMEAGGGGGGGGGTGAATPSGRNSSLAGESSSTASDFFSFGVGRSSAQDVLSDEQIENLLLSEDCAEMLRKVLNISK